MNKRKKDIQESRIQKKSVGHFNQSIGPVVSFEKNNHGVHIYTDKECARITVCSAHIIQVSIVKKSCPASVVSYAVVNTPLTTDFQITNYDTKIELHTQALKLVIQKYPLRLAFFTLNDELINEDHHSFGTSWIGHEVTCYKAIHYNEKYIGLGEKNGHLNRSGKCFTNWNTDKFAYGVDDDPIYLSIPFYIGINGQHPYGIFFDNTYKSTFNFGASNNRFMYFQADDGEMNYYFIHHPKVADIITSYTSLTGRIDLPPLWSLGFQQCRYSYYPDNTVLHIARTFREKKIPADVIYLDIHYMDAYKVFTWHPEYFPQPEMLSQALNEYDFNLAVIVDPGIKCEKGYHAYDEALNKDYFVKYPDGEPYNGQVWPGWSCFPDFTNEEVRIWWGQKLASLTEKGVSGFWNDMNEPAAWGQHLPDLIEFNYEGEGATHKRARNIYGLQMTRSTYSGAKKLMHGKRPFVLSRAGFSGSQRYGAIWTGDNISSDEHLMAGIRLVNSMGISGIPFAGYDVGGFAEEAQPELFARWMMLGAFSPFFRAHSMINTRSAEPWSFGEEVEEISRNYISLRYRLMPYIYSTFYEATQNGLPVSRSLAIDYSFDENIYKTQFEHQYLFGKNLLVIPSESNQRYTKVYLPQGKWYNLYSDELLEGSREMLIEVPKEILPLYVKAGAIIPEQSLTQSLKQKPNHILTLHVWANHDGEFVYYEDDGNTYQFEQGLYCKRLIQNNSSEGKIIIHKQEGNYISHFKKLKILFHGFSELKDQIWFNGNPLKLKSEQVIYINPISDFDPFATLPKSFYPPLQVMAVELDNSSENITLHWK